MKKLIKHILLCSLGITLLASCSSSKARKTVPRASNEALVQYLLINASKEYNFGRLNEATDQLLSAILIDKNCDACYYLLANIFAKSGDIKSASRASNKVLSVDSTNFWYLKQNAQLSEINGNIDDAISAYEMLLNNAKMKEDIYYNLASLYSNKKEYDKALTIYDSIQKITGLDGRLVFAKQQLFYRTGNSSAALIDALAFYQKNTENPQANALLGDVFARSGNDSVAKHYLQASYDLDNDYPAPLFGLAELYRKSYDYNKFFETLNQIAIHPAIPAADKVEYIMPVMQFWQQATYQEKVEELLKNMYDANKNDWNVKQFYATFLAQTNRREDGEKIVDEELINNKKNAEAWGMKIAFLQQSDNWETIVATADSALKHVSKKDDIVLYKSFGLHELKRTDEAISTLEKYIETAKDKNAKTQAMSVLGDFYHAAGNKKQAYKTYSAVLAVDTANLPVLNNYAYYLSQDGKQLKNALEMSKKTIDAEPDNATYLDTYGWILHLLGRNEEAKPIFRRALASGGRDSAVVLEHYGDVLFSLKEYDTAILYWEDALTKKDVENAENIRKKIVKCKEIKDTK